MKTLDEVIKRIENYKNIFDKNGCFECHYYEDDCIDSCFLENVLHYLKTIETTENLYHDAVNELSKWKDGDWKDRHLPLTWDELKTMKGKPVWVHLFGSGLGEWNLIHAQLDNQIWFTDGNGYIYDMHEEKQGKTWQVYRKEKYE